ncbi:Bifunctional dihydrofolate reductase-thymidylate synthase 2 [Tetrabaena socialis]|uniref:Bifunctional dihydrofolate reductase-thymidylate synthase 2 n=1 Tax=Tetrabaena socialis TaxID=47790 RepID=A0A2J7ZJN0_9CHLO|nr:Bifunctional dihydrofolate reductase-thymidylate synthase 2 [Tetrabaena socialis]|eukprot:PNH00473.1 Bifunctional dihydrofolate reductase-thymidylate synthase 2 [Tetrabaena socialis]
MSNVSLCVAVSKGFGIGRDGALPWGHLPGDMRRFRELTLGGGVIMGRKTYESIPERHRPLRGRLNVVMSKTKMKDDQSDVIYVSSFDELHALMASRDKTWYVIGGASIFAHFLLERRVHRVHMTLIDARYEGCDTFFPTDGLFEFGMSSHSEILSENGVDYRFVTYTRIYRSDEQAYLDLMRRILLAGHDRPDRTGTGTLAVFGEQLRFDLTDGQMPMVTTRLTSFKMVILELLFFLRGCTDTRSLADQGVKIWDGNTSREFLDGRGLTDLPAGDMGAGYGFQWRHFGAAYGTCQDDYDGSGVDQLNEVVRLLKEDPTSRRICMTAWNPAALHRMALPPCHSCFVQFFVSGLELSCHMYQRSVDCFLGLAANIPSYALLTNILAMKCGLRPKELIISTGDTHVYGNHVTQIREQLTRLPLPSPRLRVGDAVKDKDWAVLDLSDFELVGYMHHPAIKAPMSV